MRYFLGGLGVIASAAFIGVSALMNWRFGYGLGLTDFDAQLYGAASIAGDVFKIIAAFLIFYYWQARSWVKLSASLVVGAIAVTYSLASSVGFSSQNRVAATGEKLALVSNYQSNKAEIKRLEARRDSLPKHRPEGVVKFEIERAKLNRRWGATAGCTDVTASASRSYCQGLAAMRAELASATASRDLTVKIDDLKEKNKKADGQTVSGQDDPQAAMIASTANLKIETVKLALMWMIIGLVEVGSTLGLWLTWGWLAAPVPRRETPPQQATQTPEGASNDNVVQIADVSKKTYTGIHEALKPFKAWFHENYQADKKSSITASDMCKQFTTETGVEIDAATFGKCIRRVLSDDEIWRDRGNVRYGVKRKGRLINAA